MKKLAISLLMPITLLLSLSLSAQNYIGIHKDEIVKRLSKEYKGFFYEKEVRVDDRGFIKFVNTLDEQTVLCMINSKGVCTAVSRMYNTWLYDKVVNELNSKFQPYGKNKWLEDINGRKFTYTLIKGKWFLTVTIRPQK